MIIIVQAATELSIVALRNIGLYRHRVFVQALGWELDVQEDLEFDQFDDASTVHLVAEDEFGEIVGYGRLLRTDRPYLLGEVFPQLLGGAPPPCAEDVWELSRFAAMDFSTSDGRTASQFSSPVALELLHEAIRYTAGQGAKDLVSVSPLGIERWLRKAGLSARRLAPPMTIGGYALFACWLDLRAAVGRCLPSMASSA